MGRRNVLVAVNKELRGTLACVADTALAEVARQLAREFDAGDRPASTQLTRVLVELRRQATSPAGGAKPTPEEEVDQLDDLASRRRARLAEAAAVEPAGAGDQRRGGGRRAR